MSSELTGKTLIDSTMDEGKPRDGLRLPSSMMSVLWLLHLAAATHRVERDSLGEVQVPEFAYWGSSTQRSIQNFQIGEHRMPHSFLRALAMQKEACARANHERLSQVPMPRPQTTVV